MDLPRVALAIASGFGLNELFSSGGGIRFIQLWETKCQTSQAATARRGEQ